MVSQGILEENKKSDSYVYEITDRGRECKQQLQNIYNDDIKLELVESLNGQSSQFLEMTSTYAFLLDLGYDQEGAELKAIELKPHLSGYAEEVANYFHHVIFN